MRSTPHSSLPPASLAAVPALLLLVLFPLAPGAAAQPAEGPEDSLFIERVDINVINVEAFVTDRDGKSVGDLTIEDFEVSEDGKPVEISNFFRNEKTPGLEEQLAADRELIARGGRGGGSLPPVAPRDVPEDQRLNLVVYVDLFNLRPANRTKVLKELGGFLEDRMYSGDRVMTIVHQSNLQLIHPFTQDIQRVIKGVEQVAGMATGGQMADAERRRARHAIIQRTENPETDQINAIESIRFFVQQQRLEAQNSMNALETVLRSLGGLPGRRALLYVSDGMEKQPGSDLFQIYTERFGMGARTEGANVAPNRAGLEVMSNDLTEVFRKVTAAANTYQVTLYTLNARGAGGLQASNLEERDHSITFSGMTGSNSERLASEQEPMIDLADETGGSAIINSSNFGGALANLSQDFDSLYSLGYRSRTGGDGRYHKIEVKVKRPGLKVRHRSGYVDHPQDKRVADRAFSSLILDLESNPLNIALDFAAPQKAGGGKYHLPMLVKIPIRDLTLLPDGGKMKAKLRLYFAVQDPDGAISEVQEIPYPVELTAAQAEENKDKEVGYVLKLAVREGTPKIAVSVWDEISGIESHLLRLVQVGKQPKAEKASKNSKKRSGR